MTTTTYGTHLPGDVRGYVEDGGILPQNPQLLSHARGLLSARPVFLDQGQHDLLETAMIDACNEFGYQVTDLAIESWHIHWIIEHGYDPVHTMIGRMKTRMRQKLNRGRIWTSGYCHRCLYQPAEVERARRYIAQHAGCRMIDGKPWPRRD